MRTETEVFSSVMFWWITLLAKRVSELRPPENVTSSSPEDELLRSLLKISAAWDWVSIELLMFQLVSTPTPSSRFLTYSAGSE